jgi:hypothetical protein
MTARGFMESAEFRNRVGGAFSSPAPSAGDTPYNREYVRQCYLVFLRREPGGGESDGWLNYLFSIGDYSGVINGFINSGEYRARFMPPPGVESPACNPSTEQVSTCEDSGGSWNYDTCSCDSSLLLN